MTEITTARRSPHPTAVDEGMVGAGRLLRGRRRVGDVHERLTVIREVQQVRDRAVVEVRAERQVAGRQNAARLRHEMGDEGHREWRAGAGKALLDLGPMSMALQPVGAGRLGQLGEQVVRAGPASGAADARLGVHDHVADEQAGPRERDERQQRGGRVAARVRDQLRAAQRVTAPLGQPVHRVVEQLRTGVRCAVPGGVCIGVAQSEVSTDVDDRGPALQQPRRERRRCAVRQRKEGHLDVVRLVVAEHEARAAQGAAARPPTACRRVRGRGPMRSPPMDARPGAGPARRPRSRPRRRPRPGSVPSCRHPPPSRSRVASSAARTRCGAVPPWTSAAATASSRLGMRSAVELGERRHSARRWQARRDPPMPPPRSPPAVRRDGGPRGTGRPASPADRQGSRRGRARAPAAARIRSRSKATPAITPLITSRHTRAESTASNIALRVSWRSR